MRINEKEYNLLERKVHYGKDYKFCNVWYNDDRRIIVMNFFGDEPHGGQHPVHWIFDESHEWKELGKFETDSGPHRLNIVPCNKM